MLDTALYTAYDDFVQRDNAEAEHNLMRAILRGAMEDLHQRGDYARHARLFFLSNEDEYLFSFRSICSHLGLCPVTIRQKLSLDDYVRPNS